MEIIHLMGAEDVRSAGVTIRNAAETMRQAAASLEDSLSRHRTFLNEWLSTLETILDERKT